MATQNEHDCSSSIEILSLERDYFHRPLERCCTENLVLDAYDYLHSVHLVLEENQKVLEHVNHQMIQELLNYVRRAKQIFLTGEGRSGLVGRMIAMRLMHLGYQVYVVGETTTPPIKQNDLLIACSGSGTTGSTYNIALISKQAGATVVAVTTQVESILAVIADLTVEIKAASKYDHSSEHSQQFAGSLFEQSLLLLFDAIFYLLSRHAGKNHDTLWLLHTNLE